MQHPPPPAPPPQSDLTAHALLSDSLSASDATDATPPPASPTHSEAVSVNSLPVGDVLALHSPPRRPSTTRPPPTSDAHATPPSRIHTQSSTVTVDSPSRRRSTIEQSRFNNRLSGFFSNLIHHRRDTITSSSTRPTPEERSNTPFAPQSEPASRTPSPAPTRPTTPPPSLPPPTLHELGLSLSAVTPDLSPSHFTSPPISGAFLAPHYLLLCHVQGLDVLPLVSPPAPQPYALVRRVAFKSVVVMEHRGVLVAIAGRRDGVRVYALEEVKKAVEWRVEVEVRRERERSRREESKRAGPGSSNIDQRDSSERRSKLSLTTPPIADKQNPKFSSRSPSISSPTPPKKPSPLTIQPPSSSPPVDPPPPYTNASDPRPPLRNQQSSVSVNIARSGHSSLSLVVVPPIPPLSPSLSSAVTVTPSNVADMSKNPDWLEGSDDEAIDILTAGASGSQALDERTSSIPPPRNDNQHDNMGGTTATLPVRSHAVQPHRRNRSPNVDFGLPRANASPALRTPPSAINQSNAIHASYETPPQRLSADVDPDEDDDDAATVPGERITLAQALLESRLPDLPPAGSLRPQEPILIHTSAPATSEEGFPLSSSFPDVLSSRSRSVSGRPERRRRRWSVLGSIFNPTGSQDMTMSPSLYESPLGSPESPGSPTMSTSESRPLARSLSNRMRSSATMSSLTPRPSTSGSLYPAQATSMPPVPPVPSALGPVVPYRLLPRILSTAFGSRRSDDRPPTFVLKNVDMEQRKNSASPLTPQAPPPKLEYVKLPGTKGSLLIKAVETQRKSFLAILCGDNGEKVELFAGTYRTALGLSRTFILPDSPKSLELQLQGDDLVEVFLVFSQNVFGLEPATVRVREVRIGRAERRAARRRMREIRNGQTDLFDTDPQVPEDEDNVNLGIGVAVPSDQDVFSRNSSAAHLSEPVNMQTGSSGVHGSALAHAEELVALASVQVGSYTTFQQLPFAPKIPLATIADEYIIPPTYPDFLEYRAEHEPDTYGDGRNLATIQFNPPGLPMPAPAPPSRWFYRDPKGVVHGPWKASLMQAWYKDGLLPPDLPVRKEEDDEYRLLRDLRQQCVDPVHPFRSAPPLPTVQPNQSLSDAFKPLLPPVSLLVQPRHFGPPALFFSSRGGHSTSIVDARGRSVLRGKFLWSSDEEGNSKSNAPRMGDIKRLEAFDVKDRSVLVAMRQGGLEAMDLGDALFKPADESRAVLPYFLPPPSNTNRRGPFVWKIGTAIDSSSGGTALSSRAKTSYLGRKASYPPGKSPSRNDFPCVNDGDQEFTNEIIFLGRTSDDLYLCERNGGVFRILRLRPDSQASF